MWWIALASVVVNALGSISAGRKAKKQAAAEAEASEYDAALARERAETTRQVYGQREEALRRQTSTLRGSRRAAIAQSGTGFGGSNADVDFQSEVMAELDALNIRYEGQMEAYYQERQAGRYELGAAAARAGGRAAETQGYLGAAGAALSGGADLYRVGRYGQSGPSPRQYSAYGGR